MTCDAALSPTEFATRDWLEVITMSLITVDLLLVDRRHSYEFEA